MSDRSPLKKRHVVTVVFCDISESTRLAEDLDLEEYNAVLESLRISADSIISEFGGAVVRIDGDGIVFIFGYPEVYEDAPKRAIEASLKLRAWTSSISQHQGALKVPLQLHIGIHSGIVLLKQGDLSRGRYEILGDTTNVASRLCSAASAGEILISCDALGANRHIYDTSEPEFLDIRSRTNGLFVCKVNGSRKNVQSALREPKREPSQFIGRGEAIDRLTQFLASDGGEQIAVIRSEPGMGKSSLMSELFDISISQGLSPHRCYCRSYRGSSHLEPIEQLIGSLSQLVSSSGNLRSEVTDPNAPRSGAFRDFRTEDGALINGLELYALVSSFNRVIGDISNQYKGVVLLLDDWHWADDTSRTFVDILLKADISNLRIVLAKRFEGPEETFASDTVEIDLEPLSYEASRAIAKRIEPTLDPLALSKIYELSGGNPLYIEELSYAAQRNLKSKSADTSDAWIHSIIQARFSNLDDDRRNLLEVASVIGRVAPSWLIADVIGMPIENAIFESLERDDFLYPDEPAGHYRFKHGITRDAIYSLISPSDKKRLNSLVAAKLTENAARQKTSSDAGELARYYFESADTKHAVEYSIEAGKLSLINFALDKAQHHFQSALDHVYSTDPTEDEVIDLIRLYGRASIVDPSWEMLGVLERISELARSADHQAAESWSHYYLAFISYGLGNIQDAITLYHHTQKLAEASGLTSLCTRVDASLGQVYGAACLGADALERLDKSIAVQKAKLTGTRPPGPLAYTLGSKGFTLMDMGETEAALSYLHDACALMDGHRTQANLPIQSFLGAGLTMAGRFEEVIDIMQPVYEMAEQMRSRFHLAHASSFLNTARFYHSRDESILARIEVSVRQWAMKSHHHISIVYGYLSDGYAQLGNTTRAATLAEKALERAPKGDRFGETIAYRSLALVAWKTGNRSQAQTYLTQAYASAERRYSRRDALLTQFFEHRHFNTGADSGLVELRAMGIDPEAFYITSEIVTS